MSQLLFLSSLAALTCSVLALTYTYVGYPMLVFLLARLRPRPSHKSPYEPSVSLIIAAYNEEKEIAAKLDDSLALDYPRNKLDVIVASDGSTDRTDDIVRSYADRGVRLFVPQTHLGKTGTAIAVVPEAKGEILVFSDATGMYDVQTIRALAANFADPEVGAVTGRVVYTYDQGVAAQGFAAYQRFVVPQRQAESRFGTETSVSGSIHAIRRELFRPAPANLSYDMVHPLHVAEAGFRTVYEDDAVSHEVSRTHPEEEFRCRVRLAVRAYSFIPYLLRGLPRCSYRLYIFQVLSHKMSRWLSPVFLLIGLLAAAALAFRGGWWTLPLLVAGVAMAAAGLGWIASRLGRSAKLLAPALFFATINVAFLVGLARYLFGARLAGWTPER
jgi:cellulose synthase/poly-beta-1,6-N-acetylglucosamine synthase-like glycosyltransferase